MFNNKPVEAGVVPIMGTMTGDQLIKASVGSDVEVRASYQPMEEVPSSLQGVEEVSLCVGRVLLKGASAPFDVTSQHSVAGAVVEVPSLMVEGSIKMAISKVFNGSGSTGEVGEGFGIHRKDANSY